MVAGTMTTINPIATALTGLNASVSRLNASAGSIANAQTSGYVPQGVAAPSLPAGVSASPNVDLATEMVNQLTALHAYRANLETIRTADDMQAELLKVV
jgi:flagellar hook protein FlgE